MASQRPAQGFTLIELVVAVCVIGLLAAVALDRFRDLQGAAEEAAMERSLGGLKAALLVRSAELASANRWSEMAGLQAVNPFTLLEEVPGNYAGESDGVPPAGTWSYSPRERAVRYGVRNGGDFRGDSDGEMRFYVVAVDAQGRRVEGKGAAYVKLSPGGNYVWRERILR